MNRLSEKRISNRNVVKSILGAFVLVIAVISTVGIFDTIENFGYSGFNENILPAIIFNFPVIIAYLVLSVKKIKFNQNEKDIFIIALNYLKYIETSENNLYKSLRILFAKHPEEDLKKLLYDHQKNDTPVYASCKNLAAEKPEIRYYALYSLFDMASMNGILTTIEEEFIEETRKLLRVHSNTFAFIKNAYVKKGLKEERKIYEEQSRKETAVSFHDYDAYKILGVSQAVTKARLKRAYRTLAKKYHPDKFHEQSEEIIQQAEEKFQEITKAYKKIIKLKNF